MITFIIIIMIALYIPLSIQQVVRWLVNEQYDGA
jgi:hypothetical protein